MSEESRCKSSYRRKNSHRPKDGSPSPAGAHGPIKHKHSGKHKSHRKERLETEDTRRHGHERSLDRFKDEVIGHHRKSDKFSPGRQYHQRRPTEYSNTRRLYHRPSENSNSDSQELTPKKKRIRLNDDRYDEEEEVACGKKNFDKSSAEQNTSNRFMTSDKIFDDPDRQTKQSNDFATSTSSEKNKDKSDKEDLDWEKYKSYLDEIFFRDVDLIRRNSQEYHDFWLFLKKYQDFQLRNSNKQSKLCKDEAATSVDNRWGVPIVYDKRFRINISLGDKNLEVLLNRCRWHKRVPELNVSKLEKFQQILLHYADFQQKQKFARLKKIKKDQQNLPIYYFKDEIIDSIAKNQVVVVAGDTGCGKSTQVPQYMLDAGYGNIACTQPRRIACISLSKRVSFETLNEYGSEVAFQVRFEKSRTKATKILFLTEGLLLRQIEIDPTLKQYSVILIDEVHERHIHTDFLLGVIKCILHQRSDLKLVLMSATINIDLFSGYFENAPVCKVPGRLYPIQLQYVPKDMSEISGKKERFDPSPYLKILQLIDHKYPLSERGDVLVFLSGMSEIMSLVEAVKDYAQKVKSWIVLPLHSALSIAEQDKVFDYAPEGIRKCIVSTNIAETSVTIDGVRFVVDSGKVKEMNYDTKYNMQKLQEFWISQASAEQRKGRAGRTGPGICYRLYTQSDYDAFQEYSTPEIQRVPLDNLLLQMISMGLPDTRKFPFIEPPPASTIETSIAFLKDQGAIHENEQLTPIGQLLAQLPVDVVVGKMLVMASVFDMIDPVLTIAAGLCVQSVFTSNAHRNYDAIQLRKSFDSDHGDPLTLLNAFDSWVKVKAEDGDSRKWCKRRGLEEQRFYEMTKLKQQFYELLTDHGLLDREPTDNYSDRDERRQKTMDRRRLGQLKHEQRRTAKKRKVLKVEDEDWKIANDEDNDDDNKVKCDYSDDLEGNIKDLEFRLKNDLNQLQEKADSRRCLTLKDITLLKIILCSGLYPQVAIADEHNSFKAESEQVFHTKAKGFVLLHPTSIFSFNPEVLELKDHEVKEVPGKTSKNHGRLSNKHQLLTFLSLLETTKPYLVGSMRVPTLQTVLLFSNSLDTNQDLKRIICDEWLEIDFEEVDQAETIISAVLKLRTTWQHLLLQKLALSGRNPSVDKVMQRKKLRHTQKVLSSKLTEFLHSDIYYYIRRVHTAEIENIYLGPQTVQEIGHNVKDVLLNLMQSGGEPHPFKGGLQVTPYLIYNCLQEDENSSLWTQCMQRHWICQQCHRSMIVTIAEKLKHEEDCQKEELVGGAEQAMKNVEEEEKEESLNSSRKPYRCVACSKDFKFTTAEIFKHKRSCAAENS